MALGQAGGHALRGLQALEVAWEVHRVFPLAPDHGLGSSAGGAEIKDREDCEKTSIQRSVGPEEEDQHQLEWACSLLLYDAEKDLSRWPDTSVAWDRRSKT